jgi:hypothetical protein
VEIGRLYDTDGDYRAYAEDVLREAYNFERGKVFFKPTLAYGPQTFRTTKEGALAYFVGGKDKYEGDEGFALKPWVGARYENVGSDDYGIQIYGSTAITMGNVWVTDKEGNTVRVDKTFVFKKGEELSFTNLPSLLILIYNQLAASIFTFPFFSFLPLSFFTRSGAISRLTAA